MDTLQLPPTAERSWVVLKYGGTSVSTAKTWAAITERAKCLLPRYNVWITVSAISQVTNNLIRSLDEAVSQMEPASYQWIFQRHVQLAEELGLGQGDAALPDPVRVLLAELKQILDGVRLTGEVSPRLRARVLAMGELMSSHLGLLALRGGVPEDLLGDNGVSRVDARKLLHAAERNAEQDEDRYLEADVQPSRNQAQAEKEANGSRLVICQGFIASTAKMGHTCVLGRGGSDTSGALFAALLNAEKYEIWTDVHGMFTSDPRNVKTAKHIVEISYREAQELAAMGAKVLHPRCLGPAEWGKFIVEIRNTMDPTSDECTRICSAEQLTDDHTTVMAVTRRTGQVLLTLENFDMWGASGFLSKAFAPFDSLGISVDLIATSQYAVSMTLDHIPGGVEGEPYAALVRQLKTLGRVTEEKSCAVVSIVGRRLRSALHLMADAFKYLVNHNVYLLCESTEDLNMSFVIENPNDGSLDQLVRELHQALLEPNAVSPLNTGQGTPAVCRQGSLSALTDPNRPSLFGRTWKELMDKVNADKPAPAAETPAATKSPTSAVDPTGSAGEEETINDDAGFTPISTKLSSYSVASSSHAVATASPGSPKSPPLHPSNQSLLGMASQVTTNNNFAYHDMVMHYPSFLTNGIHNDVYYPAQLSAQDLQDSWWRNPSVLQHPAIAGSGRATHLLFNLESLRRNVQGAVARVGSRQVWFDVTNCSNHTVLRELHSLSVGFVCPTIQQVRLVRSVAGHRARILFNAGLCSNDDLVEAARLRVRGIVIDSVDVLDQFGEQASALFGQHCAVFLDIASTTIETVERDLTQAATSSMKIQGVCLMSGSAAPTTDQLAKLAKLASEFDILATTGQGVDDIASSVILSSADVLQNAAVLLTHVNQTRHFDASGKMVVGLNCLLSSLEDGQVDLCAVNLSNTDSQTSDVIVQGLDRVRRSCQMDGGANRNDVIVLHNAGCFKAEEQGISVHVLDTME